MSDPTCAIALPTSPPFRVAMCNLPSPVTKKTIVDWLERAERGKRNQSPPVLVEQVELPKDGTAGYAIVTVKSFQDVKNAVNATYGRLGNRVVWLSVAGAETLTKDGKCALAEWVDSGRGFY